MTQPRFLVDENVPSKLGKALLQAQPSIDYLTVGESGAPPRRTKDTGLLLAAYAGQRILLTLDKDSMVGHLIDHYAAGNHTYGVIMVTKGFPMSQYVDDLLLIWDTTTRDEWI